MAPRPSACPTSSPSAPAVGGGGEDDGPTTTIIIGVSLPLTGDFSEPGKGVQQGYEAWAKIVNDKGGLLGGRST